MNRCDYLDPALGVDRRKRYRSRCELVEIGFDMLTRAKSYHLRDDLIVIASEHDEFLIPQENLDCFVVLRLAMTN